MNPVSRRVQLIAFGGLALVFALALFLLRPVVAPLPDAEYVAIAKDTPQDKAVVIRALKVIADQECRHDRE